MLITHIKQAWQLLRQNKLFSGIYIFGTAIAIAFTSVFAITYYIKIAPTYPEYHKGSMAQITRVKSEGGPWPIETCPSYKTLKEYIYPLKNAECVSAYIPVRNGSIDFDDERPALDAVIKPTDPEFFELYDYDFVSGGPFSRVDFDSRIPTAAISDKTAVEVFGSVDKAVGNTILLDNAEYKVCGVFREGSALNTHSFAHAVIPYTCYPGFEISYDRSGICGIFYVLMTSNNLKALKEELAEVQRKYNSISADNQMNFSDQPISNLQASFDNGQKLQDFDWMNIIRRNCLILLALLIVPALNLSGMISSRIDSRANELGIRKSFGATRRRLLNQILWENLLLTTIGGVIGLIIAWMLISTGIDWIFRAITSTQTFDGINLTLTGDMLFAPAIFIFTFCVCIVLNLLSSFVPAWLSLRRPIVSSLK